MGFCCFVVVVVVVVAVLGGRGLLEAFSLINFFS